MVGQQLHRFVRNLRTRLGPGGDPADAQLLERFVAGRDEAAFEVLVWRHGPMVLGVCGRVLGHEQDAEDVFQATFLTLARQAGSIARGESLGGWLYRTACRAALRARARRPSARSLAVDVAAPFDPDETARAELRPLLDEEINRLPAKYRTPIVLCYLEGLTLEEAARQLGCPRGTVSSRLAAARDRLRGRLARRGLGATAGFAALLSGQVGGAAPAAALVRSTVRAALLPAPGGVPVPVPSPVVRWKVGMVLLAATLAASGAALLGQRPSAPPAAQKGEDPSAKESKQVPGTDAHGDPLPPGARARLGTVRLRHGEHVGCVAYSPDGKLLASGGGDNLIRLWEPSSGRPVRALAGHRDRQFSLAFSPDGKRLASASNDSTVRLWGPATGKEVRSWHLGASAAQVVFSPDGTVLAGSSWGGLVFLWDVASGKELRRLTGHTERVFGIAFAPDGRTLVSSGWEDKTLREWDVATGKERRRFGNGLQEQMVATFSPDGTLLASGGIEGPIRLWDVATGKEIGRLVGHERFVQALSFTKDGKTLVSASCSDRTLRVWDVPARKQVRLLGRHLDLIYGVSLSPDDKVVASAGQDNLVRMWDLASGKELRPGGGHEHAVWSVAFAPDGRTLFTGSRDGTVRAWDAATGKELRRFEEGGGPSVAVSPDGRSVAIAGGGAWARLRDAQTGKERWSVSGRREWDFCLAFSPDGTLVAGTHPGGTKVALREVASGKERHLFDAGPNGPARVAFSPDGRILAAAERGGHFVGTVDGFARVWDVATGRELRRWAAHKAAVQDVAFSPDGRMLATAGGDMLVKVWEVATGGLRLTLKGHTNWVYCVAFSPDGRLLASGEEGQTTGPAGSPERSVRVWDVVTGKEVRRLVGHGGTVRTVAFSPDGRVLASASSDTTVLLWECPAVPREPTAAGLAPGELERLWSGLASGDATGAYEAIGRLVASPGPSVPFLRRQVRPVPAPDPERVARLLSRLDSASFSERQKATEELSGMGDAVEGALRKALEGGPGLEPRRRIEQLLEKLSPTATDRLRASRAVEAIERAGTPEARQALGELAGGAAGAWLTREARAALDRLEGRGARAR